MRHVSSNEEDLPVEDCLFEGSRVRETSLENALEVDLAGVCLSIEGEGAGGEGMPWREWQAGWLTPLRKG